MASGFIGNEVPRKGLRVRSPCPPLSFLNAFIPPNALGLGILDVDDDRSDDDEQNLYRLEAIVEA